MLAIMAVLEEWRHHLLGAKLQFEIWTDHQNLTYFKKPQKMNRRQARWITELQEYNFTLHHKPGKTNVKADLLSRRSDHKRGENDNEDITMLKPEWFRHMKVSIEGQVKEFVEQINKAMIKRKMVNRVVKKALAGKEKGWEQLAPHCTIKWQEWIYVPKDKKLQDDIIQAHHDTLAAGHPGHYKTQELITRNYRWLYIQSDV